MPLTIQFLDVGQGDGIYIEFPNGINMLIDLGSTKNKASTQADVLSYFTNHTRFKDEDAMLNYLIITHPDSDHYNIMNAFLTQLKPEVEWYTYGGPPGLFSSTTWKSAVQKAKAKFFKFSSLPMELKRPGGFGPGVTVRCLAYDTEAASKKDTAWVKNTSSVVLQIVYNTISIMLTGDATEDTEREILTLYEKRTDLNSDDLRSNVLKVAHHGSARTSNCEDWIKAVDPEMVFISSDRSGLLCGDEKSTGHRLPQELTLDLIRSCGTRLSNGDETHTYISSYDPKDYKPYKGTITPANKPTTIVTLKPKGKKPVVFRQWLEVPTKENIYTTTARMGKKNKEADQGSQYELSINANGKISLTSTFAFD